MKDGDRWFFLTISIGIVFIIFVTISIILIERI